ncbi:MAG: helix-turn-helix transcriptional regulator [Thermoguttaceae bacterium]
MATDISSETPALITATDFAAMLKVSVRTLWRLRSGGKIPEPVRLGGAVRWRLDEVKDWIAGGCRMSTNSQ